MSNSWLIKNGRIVDPVSDRDEIGDLFISGGVIAPLSPASTAGVPVIDAAGLVIAPGLIDLHAHFREPGGEEAETIESGSAAAAAGGFTTVVTMPNTTPATDNPKTIADAIERGRIAGKVNVLPAGCVTRQRRGGELADLAAMAKAGAIAFTDDGSTISDDKLMAQAMRLARDLDIAIMDHALDPRLAGNGVMHEGKRSVELGLADIPSEAEIKIVRRDIALAEETGCRVHIQHVSARESVELIRAAKKRGAAVSGEATPHHIALSDADVRADDANFKMNPPLRSEDDRLAIAKAVADGTLEAFATDHAPHRAEDKARGFKLAPFGVVGLETAVGVTYTFLVKSGAMALRAWLARWTAGPARILGLSAPSLSPGAPADVVALDLENEWVVDSRKFLSKSRNTPFEGRRLIGRAAFVFLRGVPTCRRATDY